MSPKAREDAGVWPQFQPCWPQPPGPLVSPRQPEPGSCPRRCGTDCGATAPGDGVIPPRPLLKPCPVPTCRQPVDVQTVWWWQAVARKALMCRRTVRVPGWAVQTDLKAQLYFLLIFNSSVSCCCASVSLSVLQEISKLFFYLPYPPAHPKAPRKIT